MLNLGTAEFFGEPIDGSELVTAIAQYIPLKERIDDAISLRGVISAPTHRKEMHHATHIPAAYISNATKLGFA